MLAAFIANVMGAKEEMRVGDFMPADMAHLQPDFDPLQEALDNLRSIARTPDGEPINADRSANSRHGEV